MNLTLYVIRAAGVQIREGGKFFYFSFFFFSFLSFFGKITLKINKFQQLKKMWDPLIGLGICRYCLGYCSDMRTEVVRNRDHPSLHRRHACEVDSSSTWQA